MKPLLVAAIQWTFGISVKGAMQYYRMHKKDTRLLNEIQRGYVQHCKRAWNND